MNILHLDEYSLKEIIAYLDFESWKNVGATCHKLKDLCLRFYNQYLIEESLKKQIVHYLYDSHNRDDFLGSLSCIKEVLIVLQCMLQTLDCCYMNDFLERSEKEDSMEKLHSIDIIKTLLSNNCGSCKCLQIIHWLLTNIPIHINYWYAFHITDNEFIYLCNIDNPNNKFVVDTRNFVICFHYRGISTSIKIYTCHEEIYLPDTKLDVTLECFNDLSIFKTICDILTKKFDFPSNGNCRLTTELLFNIGKNKLPHCNQPINQKIDRHKTEMKNKFSKQIEKFDMQQTDALVFIQNLKIYINLIGFKARDFMIEIMRLIYPLHRTALKFKFGELLAYSSLVKELLPRTRLVLDHELKMEIIIIQMDNNTKLESNLQQDRLETYYTIKLNEDIILHFNYYRLSENYAEGPVYVDWENILIDVFEKFIETYMHGSDIPIMSTRFVLELLSSLHSVTIFGLQKII